MPSDTEADGEESIDELPKYSSSGHNSFSIKEAVRIAQSNNFMGLMCTSRLLVCFPSIRALFGTVYLPLTFVLFAKVLSNFTNLHSIARQWCRL